MDQREQDVINNVGWRSWEEKIEFLKAYFDALTPEEMKSVRNVAQRYKRRKDMRVKTGLEQVSQKIQEVTPGTEHTPAKAEQPVQETAKKGWWRSYKKRDIVAIDCEMVAVPRGRKYFNAAAIVGICDFWGNILYNKKVRRPTGSFKTSYYSEKINGIKKDSLEDGVDIEIVLNEVEEILREKLIVGHAVSVDIQSLELQSGNFDVFDLQWEWWREDESNGSRLEFKLKALHKHFFPTEQFQDGIHSPIQDAQVTMKIFREIYTAGWKTDNLELRYNPNPIPPGKIDPLKCDKSKHRSTL